MPYVSGWLIEGVDPGFGNRPGGPVDPGFGRPGGGHIDNSLPPGVPPIGVTLPEPPPGIWPPPSFTRPIVPVNPPGVDNTLPVQPGTIWPSPGRPARPDHGLPGGGQIDNTLPGGGGGQIDNSLPSQTFWVVAGIPGVGWRYIAVDPSLEIGHTPPGATPK